MAVLDTQIMLEAIGLVVLSLVFYRLLLSPLAFLPGPKICALTRLLLMFHEFRGNRRTFIHNLHLQYGPVVRIAPDEVSFASREAAKEIYTSGGSGYDKSSFYRLFENFGTPNIFSTLEKRQHADLKKRFAERYSKAHVMDPDVSAVIQEHVDAFFAKISENVGKSLDIYVCLSALLCAGRDHGSSLLSQRVHSITDEGHRAIMHEMSYGHDLRRAYFQYYFPTLYRIFSKLPGIASRRERNLIQPYVINSTRSATVASHTVLSKLRATDGFDNDHDQDYDNNTDKDKDDTDNTFPTGDWRLAASECLDDVVAGIDTTGDALCFLIYHLSLPTPSSQHVQARLRTELLTHAGAAPADLDALPYLDAVVKEGLRVFGPIPMGLPRVVPASTGGGGVRAVDGVRLPAGTIVSCQAHTMHRLDGRVFPDPEAFVPERWLEAAGAGERNQLFFAFAAGGRGCIGKHLALLEMKLLLRAVYSAYRTSVSPEMEASMEMDDQTISSRPKDMTCLIVFEKYDDHNVA